jgi:hypothetical protein
MNISPSVLYLITRLDGIVELCVGLSALMFVLGIFIGGLRFIQRMDDMPESQREVMFVRRLFYAIVIAFGIFLTCALFIPSTKTAKIMLGCPDESVKECNCNE